MASTSYSFEDITYLGSLLCTIVGIQDYAGTAHHGEHVRLIREPNNPHDRNAIRVDNIMHNEQVGYIKATQALSLAPIMDKFACIIQVDGTISSPDDRFTISAQVKFYFLDSSSPIQDPECLKALLIQNFTDPPFVPAPWPIGAVVTVPYSSSDTAIPE